MMIKPLKASFVTPTLSLWRKISTWLEVGRKACFDWKTYGNLMFRHIFPETEQSFHQRIFYVILMTTLHLMNQGRWNERGRGSERKGKKTWSINLLYVNAWWWEVGSLGAEWVPRVESSQMGDLESSLTPSTVGGARADEEAGSEPSRNTKSPQGPDLGLPSLHNQEK